MTEFRVEAVRIGPIEKHPNADSLSITSVLGGYPCIIRTGDFAVGDIAVYVPVDAMVPVERPEFAFLAADARDGFARIKARRLRGIFSMGLLVRTPDGVAVGQDCREMLGIGKWLPLALSPPGEPEIRGYATHGRWPWWRIALIRIFPSVFRARRVTGPAIQPYDIEGHRRYKHLFGNGEEVVLTEKIHGAQLRACYCKKNWLSRGKFYLGSRNVWGRVSGTMWGQVALQCDLTSKLRAYPNLVLFGEVYGNVQDLKYGLPNGVDLRVFDFMHLKTRKFMEYDDARALAEKLGLKFVPELYRGPWKPELVELAEGKTTIPGANHVREGWVAKPIPERHDPHFGRVILKLPGEGYLTRKSQ